MSLSVALPNAVPTLETAKDAVRAALATVVGRRRVATASPVFFDTYYCGMRYARHRDRWLTQIEAMRRDARRRNRKRRLLLLAPRDHGKTEALISVAVRLICLDRNIRILWISEAADVARKRLARIQALLQDPRVVEDWGEFKKGAEVWDKSRFIVAGRTIHSVDSTVEAVGAGGAITGGHFDVILTDDLETNKTVYSPTLREKTRDWWNATVSPMLVPGGLLVMIGTRKHHDDLYAHRKRDTTFDVIEDAAISQWPQVQDEQGRVRPGWKYRYVRDKMGRRVCVGVAVVAPSRVLWPEERPIEYLLLERESSSPTAFGREFQHVVQDDSTAPVKMRDIERARDKGAALSLYEIPTDVRLVDVVQGWDLALVTDPEKAEKSDTDYTVGITWGKDVNGNRYLLGVARFRGLKPSHLRDKIVAEYRKFTRMGVFPRVVAVEHNAFGELHFLGLQATTDLPLVPHQTTGQKKADPWDGIPAISSLFENGKVVLPTKTEADRGAIEFLCQELHGLGREAHDDGPLALWIAELQTRVPENVYRVGSGDTYYESVSGPMGKGQEPTQSPTAEPRDPSEPEPDPAASALWGDFPWYDS